MKNAFIVSASIACGKSTFLEIAKNMGFKTLSADSIAHEILDSNAKEINALFSNNELLENDKINRKKLGQVIFNDKNEKKKLENFMFPRIRAKICEAIEILNKKNKPFFIEIPLFFESNFYKNLGQSILIYTPKEQALKRLMKRDNISKEDALIRLNSQLDIEEKKKLADFVIYNTTSYENFQEECVKFIQRIKKGDL
ncbi:dephospho-CoA kinase [Campylobacter sp. LR196d]|uniref:dephospho-CoA kinase n=1 Tax=unclassified Campylobacter TaxID=2593542 RepID=UPI0012380EAB|nr:MULTISPECIES: dephospho-CoA kinase [unclassified Campylobacter]KAA6227961.1 dephospho-CoA kinase [Campylobacter sp. LR185c]KAA6228371.1 dephospho-CoA kinase [Campylobacter sp. LR196d]KAA8604350.1 dephospho-CoA kinase [Campylobacter sp. LR185c]